MPNICGTFCSYVCSPCTLVKNLLCGQSKKVKVDDDDNNGNFRRDPRFDIEAYADDPRGSAGQTPRPYSDNFSDHDDHSDSDGDGADHGEFDASLRAASGAGGDAASAAAAAAAAQHKLPSPIPQHEAFHDVADPSVALLSMEQDLDSFLENMRNSNADLEADLSSGDSDSRSSSDGESDSERDDGAGASATSNRSSGGSGGGSGGASRRVNGATSPRVGGGGYTDAGGDDEDADEESYHDDDDDAGGGSGGVGDDGLGVNVSVASGSRGDLHHTTYKDLSDSSEEDDSDGEAEEASASLLLGADSTGAATGGSRGIDSNLLLDDSVATN